MGGGAVKNTNLANAYAAPAGLAPGARFLSTNTSPALGLFEEQAAFGAQYNHFGLYWGSIDAYNTLTFVDKGLVVAAFTGSQITATVPTIANSDQASA